MDVGLSLNSMIIFGIGFNVCMAKKLDELPIILVPCLGGGWVCAGHGMAVHGRACVGRL